MIARSFEFPNDLELRLQRYLESCGTSLSEVERYASDIRTLANRFTQSEGHRTPWDLALAYMVYYFPLNVVRLLSVLKESFHDFPWESVTNIVDFGSGPGTVHAAFEQSGLTAKPILSIEIDTRASTIHKALGLQQWPCEWGEQLPGQIKRGSLGVFSYSLLEEESVSARLKEFDHILIVTPSTRSQGRRLLEIRKELLGKGFASWAPCTHQLPCPLLNHSKSDWCHDRIAFGAPTWYLKLESHLPFYNNTLTYSYWFGSRAETPPIQASTARIIGDTLYEKGKIRQMICRGSNREFLAWLTRDGEPSPLPRGIRIQLPDGIQLKGNELRGLTPKKVDSYD